MKITRMKTGMILVVLVMMLSQLSAQGYGGKRGLRGRENPFCLAQDSLKPGLNCRIPDLTPEQDKEIRKLNTAFHKEAMQIKNQIAEKKARLQTLRTADKADMAAIDKTIDELAALKTQLMKKKERRRQEIRALLNDEQRLFFDSKAGKMGKKGKAGRGHGRGNGGNCDGSGPHGRGQYR